MKEGVVLPAPLGELRRAKERLDGGEPGRVGARATCRKARFCRVVCRQLRDRRVDVRFRPVSFRFEESLRIVPVGV